MKKNNRTVHILECKKCGRSIKVYCELKRGCYSQKPLECPQCNYFAGWITSCPGYKVERLVSIIEEVSCY